MTQTEWAEGTTNRIAGAVRALRGKRSAQWLADRTAELGHPMSRTAISNLEVGRKGSVDVLELIVLARALGVPPLLLLYPEQAARDVEVLPDYWATSWTAAQWFAGRAPWTVRDKAGKVVPVADYESGARLLRLAQQDEELQRLLSRLSIGVRPNTHDFLENQRQREIVANRIQDVRREMRYFGGHPQFWPDEALYRTTDPDE